MKSILQCGSSLCFRRFAVFLPLFIFSLFNSGCSSFSLSDQKAIEIHYTSPDRISFQGKGAGAGMALMSTMGPVGIALGVAIDEGIAKDIRETAVSGNVDFKVIFKNSISEIPSLKNASRIEVKKYGFVIKDGSNDYVAAEIHLKVIDEANKESDVILSSWACQQKNEEMITLDDLKHKAESTKVLFDFSLQPVHRC